MIYFSRRCGHITEAKLGRNDHTIFCIQCRKNIPKFDTYKFQFNGKYYLARNSEPPLLGKSKSDTVEEKRAKWKWNQRKYRSTEKGRAIKNAANRAYRARKKAEKLGQQQT